LLADLRGVGPVVGGLASFSRGSSDSVEGHSLAVVGRAN